MDSEYPEALSLFISNVKSITFTSPEIVTAKVIGIPIRNTSHIIFFFAMDITKSRINPAHDDMQVAIAAPLTPIAGHPK